MTWRTERTLSLLGLVAFVVLSNLIVIGGLAWAGLAWWGWR